jgi:hypothetical protein
MKKIHYFVNLCNIRIIVHHDAYFKFYKQAKKVVEMPKVQVEEFIVARVENLEIEHGDIA